MTCADPGVGDGQGSSDAEPSCPLPSGEYASGVVSEAVASSEPASSCDGAPSLSGDEVPPSWAPLPVDVCVFPPVLAGQPASPQGVPTWPSDPEQLATRLAAMMQEPTERQASDRMRRSDRCVPSDLITPECTRDPGESRPCHAPWPGFSSTPWTQRSSTSCPVASSRRRTNICRPDPGGRGGGGTRPGHTRASASPSSEPRAMATRLPPASSP